MASSRFFSLATETLFDMSITVHYLVYLMLLSVIHLARNSRHCSKFEGGDVAYALFYVNVILPFIDNFCAEKEAEMPGRYPSRPCGSLPISGC